MSNISRIVRGVVVACSVAFGLNARAVEGLTYTWRDGWDADSAQTVSYGAYTGQNGILFAGQQMGIVAQVKLVSNVSANIINFGGDNRVVLATDADGRYTLSSNVAALNGHTSETVAETGWHRYSMFVRRGVNGSGHAASVIVYEDGAELFKVCDGSFVTGPFRNLTIGGKQGNLAKGGHWSDHLAAGAVAADDDTIAAIEADCVKLYPAVDESIVAKIGDQGYKSLADALAVAEGRATEESPVSVRLVQAVSEDVTVPANVTLEMSVDNRLTGAVSGAGTIKFSHATTATQGSLATWIASGKMSFGNFTGTVHLAAGRFNATDALIPATVKIKVTSGAQIFIDGGTWTNTFDLEGTGYGAETGGIGRAALRFENGDIDGITVVSSTTDGNAPAIGSHNANRTFAFKVTGEGDLRLVQGTGTHTYQLTNAASDLSGTITVVDQNLTLEYAVAEGEKTVANAIAGAGKLKKSGAGTIKFTGDNSLTGGLVIDAGTVVGTFAEGVVTTTVANKKVVASDLDAEGCTTYSLVDTAITFTFGEPPEGAVVRCLIDGVPAPESAVVGNALTAPVGSTISIIYYPDQANGYLGSPLGLIDYPVTAGMTETQLAAPTAEELQLKKAVAAIEDIATQTVTLYPTLAAAVDAVDDSNAVILVGDIGEESIEVSKNVNICLDGATVSFGATFTGSGRTTFFMYSGELTLTRELEIESMLIMGAKVLSANDQASLVLRGLLAGNGTIDRVTFLNLASLDRLNPYSVDSSIKFLHEPLVLGYLMVYGEPDQVLFTCEENVMALPSIIGVSSSGDSYAAVCDYGETRKEIVFKTAPVSILLQSVVPAGFRSVAEAIRPPFIYEVPEEIFVNETVLENVAVDEGVEFTLSGAGTIVAFDEMKPAIDVRGALTLNGPTVVGKIALSSDTATLAVPAKLSEGAVISGVDGKDVLFDETAKTYSLKSASSVDFADPETILATTTAEELGLTNTAFASDDGTVLKKVAAWAKAKETGLAALNAVDPDLAEAAYLLNVAPNAADVKDAKEDFAFDADDLAALLANPLAKPQIGSDGYNGTVTILGAETVNGAYTEGNARAKFFKATLTK